MKHAHRRLVSLLWLLWAGTGTCETDKAQADMEQHTQQLEQALRIERLKVGELQIALTEMQRQRTDDITELQRQLATLEQGRPRRGSAPHTQQDAGGSGPLGLVLALVLGLLLGPLAIAGYQHINPLFRTRRGAVTGRRRIRPKGNHQPR